MRRFLVSVVSVAAGAGFAMAASGAGRPGSQQAPVRDQAPMVMIGTGALSGTVVVDDDARAPIARATVTASRTGIEDIRTSSSDERGAFQFTGLPGGTYSVTASKGGHISMSAGAPKPGMPGRLVTLREGETVTVPPIALMRGAVIAGRVFDRAGRPVSGAQVQAVQFVIVNGERRPRRSTGATGSGPTNDHGDYRMFGLLPGEYLVFAQPPPSHAQIETDVTAAELAWAQKPAATPASAPVPPPARPARSAATLYAGAPNESAATPVILTRGEERTGVDISLQRVPVARISGVVTGLDGAPAGGVTVERGARAASAFLSIDGDAARTGPDGIFALVGVPPGDYVLSARGPVSASPAGVNRGPVAVLWGSADVTTAGDDISGLAIRLQPGMSVSGQLVAKGTLPPPDLTRATVQLLRTPSVRGLVTSVDREGRFRMEGVVPGRYRVSVPGFPGFSPTVGPYWLRSAMLGERDLTDVSFEVRPNVDVGGITITLTDARTEISGALTNLAGAPASHVYVFVFSTDREHWEANARRIASVRASENGTYLISGLPPGEYYMGALTELDTTLQYEPTFLEELVKSSFKITLGEGEKKVQNLRVGGPPWE